MSSMGSTTVDQTGAKANADTPTLFRFWHDEKRFKGTGETSLVQRALINAGGRRMGGHIKSAPTQGPLGYHKIGEWDFLWSPSSSALKAAPHIQPHQLICTVPGMFSITKKGRLPITLREAYGDDSWHLMPQTFTIPAQLHEWQEALHRAPTQPEKLWILKTAQHLGKGLKIVPAHCALKEVAIRTQARMVKSTREKPFVLAQKYIDDPLLINGHKFGIRLWVVVTGYQPLKVYLHRRGLVLFSSEQYPQGGDLDPGTGKGHVTNYAMNVDGTVWSLTQLKEHLGEGSYKTLFAAMAQTTAQVLAAALPNMLKECANLKVESTNCMELLGLDFLVDANLRPWLLEVNGTPSLAVEHSDPSTSAMIYEEKNTAVVDMVRMLRLPHRFHWPLLLPKPLRLGRDAAPPSLFSAIPQSSRPLDPLKVEAAVHAAFADQGIPEQVVQSLMDLELEMSMRGEYVPLMPLFPEEGSCPPHWRLSWSTEDQYLQRWWAVRKSCMKSVVGRVAAPIPAKSRHH